MTGSKVAIVPARLRGIGRAGAGSLASDDVAVAVGYQVWLEQLVGLASQHRIGQSADVADALALFVSSDAAWISGEVTDVNGGVA